MRKNHAVCFHKQFMTPEACLSVVSKLKDVGLYLNRSGIFSTPQENMMSEHEIKQEWDNLLIASKLVPLFVLTTSKKGLVGSYGLKHVIERALRSNYISNGDAILVMLVLGYKLMKPLGDKNPNCVFNCKYVENDFKTSDWKF